MKKILVSADCQGNFDFLLAKIEGLRKKNHFDFVLCLGDVFGDGIKLPAGGIDIPIYFVDGGALNKSLALIYPEGYEIKPNLHYLGRSGVKTIDGVKIAYLSGVENRIMSGFYSKSSIKYSSKYFTYEDVEEVIKHQDQQIDILLTNQWPEDSQRQPQQQHVIQNESELVSKISAALSPRYHFAGSERVYYKRNEFINRKGYGTAFISVAPVIPDAENKSKYLHAIQIVPFSKLDCALEKKEVLQPNPYQKYHNQQTNIQSAVSTQKVPYPANKPQELKESSVVYFQNFNRGAHTSEIEEFLGRWGQVTELRVSTDKAHNNKGCGVVVFKEIATARECLADSGKYSLHGSRIKFSARSQNSIFTEDGCWFCPESRVFDKSLVVTFGRKIYIALDKGPIVDQHFQIVPYPHIQSLIGCEQSIQEEIASWIRKLELKFHQESKSMIRYTHYLNLQSSKNHAALHCIPVASAEVLRCCEIFQRKSMKERLGFSQLKREEIKDFVKGGNYFQIQIGDNIYLKTIKDKYFSVDFGRQSVCQMLEVEERINWKGCVDSEKTEKTLVQFFELIK